MMQQVVKREKNTKLCKLFTSFNEWEQTPKEFIEHLHDLLHI